MSDVGSSSSLTPGAGDATQGAKDGAPGTPSDSPPTSLFQFVRSLGWKRYMRPEFSDADGMAAFIGEKELGDEYLVRALKQRRDIDRLLGKDKT